MKPHSPSSSLRRCLGLSALTVFAVALAAQPATTPASTAPATPAAAKPAAPASPAVASLELPRFKSKGASDTPRLVKTKVTVDDLLPQGGAGAKTTTKQEIIFLTLDAAKEWTRPLRGSPRDVTFVSFLAYASVGTVIDIGGAQITVKPSSKAGYAQLALGTPTPGGSAKPPYGDLVKLEQHDGAAMAALPVFTVRLDPVAGNWDLFVFQRLVADDLPLPDNKGARQFSMKPGAQGAWVMNLTMADENPLFIDANRNGIDDAFEKQKRSGVLLAANAPMADRTPLAQQWKESQAAANVPPWKIRRPVPDTVAATAPKK